MKKFKKRLFFVGLCATILLGAFYAFYEVYMEMPDFSALKSSVVLDIKTRSGNATTRRVGPSAPGWVSLNQISDGATFAIVASEDTSFFSHQGIDLHELKEAIKKDIKERRFARGASTLTQQVVKNVFLSNEKTLWRKFREIFWAREIEKTLSKTEILGFYLNMAEFGPGIYGVQQASSHYFNCEPRHLSARQGAFLAMLLPSPRRYYQSFEQKKLTEFAEKRVSQILRVMYRMKFINEPTYEMAQLERLFGEPPSVIADSNKDSEIDRTQEDSNTPSVSGNLEPETVERVELDPNPTEKIDVNDTVIEVETSPESDIATEPISKAVKIE